MSTSCDDSGCDGSDREMPAVRELVEADEPVAVRADRVAFGRGQMADGVRHRDLVHDFPGSELPLRDGAVDEQRGVGEAVGPELGVQRSEADRHFRVLDRLVLQDGNLVLVLQ